MGYRGIQVPIPAGLGGFDANINEFRVSVANLVRARNISFEGDSIRKMRGATAIDTDVITKSTITTSSANTTFTSTTVTDSSAWDLSAVSTDMVAVASGGSVGKVSIIDDGGDALTVISWRPSTPADTETVAVATTVNLIDAIAYQTSPTVQRIVSFWDNGSVYKEVTLDLDSVTLKTGLTATGPAMLVQGGDETAAAAVHLFLFSEGNVVQVLDADGATMGDIASPPSDWSATNQPIAGGILGRRLFGFGNSNFPHAIYFSAVDDHEDFLTGSPPIPAIFPGEGIRVAAAIPFLAAASETRLYVFKYPFGLYYLDISDPTDPLVFKVRDDIGMAGAHGWARVGDDIFFMSSFGSIHSLRAVNSSEDIKDSDISAALNLDEWMKSNIDFNRLDRVRLTYDEFRKELRIGVRGLTDGVDDTGSGGIDRNVNGTALFTDVSLGTPRLAIEDRAGHYEVMFPYLDTSGRAEIYAGGSGGTIFKLNQSLRNIDGAPFTGEFQTPSLDFSHIEAALATEEKRYDWLEIIVTPTGNYTISFDIIIDGELTETVTIDLGTDSALFGTALFGTGKFAGKLVENHKARIHGRGRRIALRGRNSGLNEDFAISQMFVHFKREGVRTGAE